MGRKKNKARGGRGINRHGGRDDRIGGGHRPYVAYPEVRKENAKLELYYNTLLCLSEEEQERFWEALRRELPNSFRFCGSKGHALAVRRLLQTRYIPQITKVKREDGQDVQPPEPVPWYPDNLAWWMTTPKQVIRKFPPFATFQRFLVSETTIGNISRQEVVSMIPPLLMDVRPGMTVLDMCAAPGSKAAQLLEMIHTGEEARLRAFMQGLSGEGSQEPAALVEAATMDADPSDDGRATGLLVANDNDYKRSQMLVHQLKRLSSPNMIVTSHDATMFPPLKIPNPNNPSQQAYLKFDRILADVPCSGDGTLRKNVSLWKEWTPGNAIGLHVMQVRILVRALQMLKVGGRVVYSTCSMNPVENEAVIGAAIKRCGGSAKIEILDCSDQLPLLKRRPGLKSWKIMDKSGRIWNTWDEVEAHTASLEDSSASVHKLTDSMFPTPSTSEGAVLPLERCMRVYSHLQDTGGFFITVLQKNQEFKAIPEEKKVVPTANGVKHEREEDDVKNEAVKRQKPNEDSGEAPPTDTDATPSVKGGQDGIPEVSSTLQFVEESQEPGAESDVETKSNSERDLDTDFSGTPPVPTNGGDNNPKRKQVGPYEEPFKYLASDNEVIESVCQFYDISSRFPKDRYMVRNAVGNPLKAIYYTSALARDVLTLNEGRAVRFVHAGVKMFVKQDSPSAEVCRWRIQAEGMPILQAYVGPARVVVLRRKETLRGLLVEMFPKFSDGGWQGMGEIGERIRDVGLGCLVLRVEPDSGDEDFTERMALPLWKSFHSLNLMLPKEDRSAMLLRIFNDTTPLVNISLKEKEKQKEAVKAEDEDVKLSVGEGVDETKKTVVGEPPEDAVVKRDTEENINDLAAEDVPSEED